MYHESADSHSAQVIQHKFMQINRLHRCAAEKLMSPTGIHRSQHMLLMHLYHTGRCPSQKEIAERFEISPAAVAVSLKKLENGGYITRICSENDNRLNEIRLTQKGREIIEFSKDTFDSLDERTFQCISDAELLQLEQTLDKIQNNLKTIIVELAQAGM